MQKKGYKIEFGLADDIRTMINALNAQKSIDDEILQKTVKILTPLQTLKREGLDRLQTNEKVIDSSKSKIKMAYDLLKKADQMASEMGISKTALNGYSEIEKLISVLEKNNQRTAKFNADLKQIV
jgi:hypothetical protein